MAEPTHYHLALTDTERALVEQQAWNFRQLTGRCMTVPARLFEDLRNGGVDMKNIEVGPSLPDRPPTGAPL